MRKTALFILLFVGLIGLAGCELPASDDEIANATFDGVEDVTIALGEEFTSLDGIGATDHDGTDLTDQIVVDGILNVNRAGAYEIIYKVIGENNVEVSATRTITVVANARIIGPEELDTNILAGDPFDPLEGVSAIDHDDTDLTESIVVSGPVVDDEGNVDTSLIGDYVLTYTVVGESGQAVEVTITITVYEMGDAIVTFQATDEETPNTYDLLLGTPFNYVVIASAEDYDGSELEIDEIVYALEMADYVDGENFAPTEPGTYTFTYKATGETGVQTETTLTVEVYQQGVVIDGSYVPVFEENINNDSKPWNSTIIYTELKGMGEYGVVIIVDAYGRIVFTRDAYSMLVDVNNPIKPGHPDQIRGVANNDGWSGANIFQGILGPQGTEGGIPEGGFAIFFNRDNVAGTSHPVRTLGLEVGRVFGAKVEIIGLDIPNYDPSLADEVASFDGVEDIVIYNDETFDPLAGVTANDAEDNPLDVTVVFNNVDMERPVTGTTNRLDDDFTDGWFSVVYQATTPEGYQTHVTRRVTVLPVMTDAVFTGLEDEVIAINEPFDPMEGVEAKDFDNSDLTDVIVVTGTVDNQIAGAYVLTYEVTGENGVLVSETRTITVVADARFVIGDMNETVYQNEAFDPFAGIEAYDYDDSDLTEDIVLVSEQYVEGTFDTSVVGTFDLLYQVTGNSGNTVEYATTVDVITIPDATIDFPETGTTHETYVGQSFDLMANVEALDYDGTPIETIDYVTDAPEATVSNDIFTPVDAGTYVFTFSVIGVNGNTVEKELTINVALSGLIINGTFVPVVQDNVDFDGKPTNSVLVFTELVGILEYGVAVIVDAHGKIVLTRDPFGEQVDINNPLKSGNPAFPTNHSGLPNFANYDAFTGGLWSHWTTGGGNVIQGLTGAQGTEGGIPAGGFAIVFTLGGTGHPARSLGMQIAREFAAEVEVINLNIPNFDPTATDTDAYMTGVMDIEIAEGESFDPLAGVEGFDHDGTPLTVNVVYNDVDTNKGVVDPQAPRVVNTQEGRDLYTQGWYRVVYSVEGENGYVVHVTRRVVVR